jgi:hypothetical protein
VGPAPVIRGRTSDDRRPRGIPAVAGLSPATGEVFYEIQLRETDPKLVFFELDLFWITFAGFDPLDYVKGAQKRFPLFHVKDPCSSATPSPSLSGPCAAATGTWPVCGRSAGTGVEPGIGPRVERL